MKLACEVACAFVLKFECNSEQWCLFLRGQASHGAAGVGRDGHVPDRKNVSIPEHFNVSRSLLYEMWKANEEQAQIEEKQRVAADLALAADDEDNPFPDDARSGYVKEREAATNADQDEAGYSDARSRRGDARHGSKGTRGGANDGLRLRGGSRAHRSSVVLLGKRDKQRLPDFSRPRALRLRGGLTLLTHNMLASPVQGLEEDQRYPLKIEATKIEVRSAESGFNASGGNAAEVEAGRALQSKHGERDFFLSLIPRLDWGVLLAALSSLDAARSSLLTRALPADAAIALRYTRPLCLGDSRKPAWWRWRSTWQACARGRDLYRSMGVI